MFPTWFSGSSLCYNILHCANCLHQIGFCSRYIPSGEVILSGATCDTLSTNLSDNGYCKNAALARCPTLAETHRRSSGIFELDVPDFSCVPVLFSCGTLSGNGRCRIFGIFLPHRYRFVQLDRRIKGRRPQAYCNTALRCYVLPGKHRCNIFVGFYGTLAQTLDHSTGMYE